VPAPPRHCTLRIPPLTPGLQWAATAIAHGIYPFTSFDTYYYLVTSGDNTRSHAGQFARDWSTSIRGVLYFNNVAPGAALAMGPTYLWDGTTLHSYGSQPFSHAGPNPPTSGPNWGVSFTLRCYTPGSTPNGFFGRKFFSPVQLRYCTGNLLTSDGLTHYNNIGQRFFTSPFFSETISYVPAILSDKLLSLRRINQWWLMQSIRPLRRRNRGGPWTALITYPPPFPTSDG
jgi:hypothetical protein